MSRPKSKTELIELSKRNFERLSHFCDALSPEEQEMDFPEGTLNRNIRDVIAHLNHWNLLFLNWYEIGMAGGSPDMPASGYTWRTIPELNRVIRKMYSNEKLIDVRKSLKKSFGQLQEIISKHSDQELFEKMKYKWTGTTSLGSYLISVSSSHYDWAYKLIKKAKLNHSKTK